MKPQFDPTAFIHEITTNSYEVIPAFVVSSPPEPTRTERMINDPQMWALGAIVVLLLILVLRRPSGSDKNKGE